MISVQRAERLRATGLRWQPRPGDQFEIPRPELTGQVFTISDMVVEAHTVATGTVLRFNGTTEWALDSVAQEDTVWLPSEEQLRELLGGAFRRLSRVDTGYEVVATVPGRPEQGFGAESAADAYADALLALISAATDPVGAGPAGAHT